MEQLVATDIHLDQNLHKLGTHIIFFKEYLTIDTNHDEEFSLNFVSIFVMEFLSLIDEAMKN